MSISKQIGTMIAVASAIAGVSGLGSAVFAASEMWFSSAGSAFVAFCIAGIAANLVRMLP